MSKGYGGVAEKALQDERIIVYRYGGYNLNDPEYCNEGHVYDGMIRIQKNALEESEIKKPNGKKARVKKGIHIDVPFEELFDRKKVVIENCSNCWKVDTIRGKDIIAYKLIYKLFRIYQEEGNLPDTFSYDV